jgi:uridine kinase
MSQLRQLIHALKLHQAGLVGIDGGVGAGKTTIAYQLSAQLRCTCVHLDSFLSKGNATFLPSIQYDHLRSAIALEKGTVVVEGVCLLAALERLSLVPDYLVFVDSEARYKDAKMSNLLHGEVQKYLTEYSPRSKANAIISLERTAVNSSYDVDIAYIKSKTIVSVTLAIGGLMQTIVGALLLNTGLNQQGTATFKILGAEVSGTGLGAIVLCSSVMWAYFACLARPNFSIHSENRNTTHADGSSEAYEFTSHTQRQAAPPPKHRT